MVSDVYTRPDEFVSQWWGDTLSDALVHRIVRAPRKHLCDFAEAFADLMYVEPELQAGQLRPLVGVTDHAGDQLIPQDYLRGTSRIRALALYAHQVAVWDPLAFQAPVIPHLAQTELTAYREQLRVSLLSILELVPLADAGIVVWIPTFSSMYRESRSMLQSLGELTVSGIDLTGVPLLNESPLPLGVPRNEFYSPWDDVDFAISDIAADLSLCQDGALVQPLAANPLADRLLLQLLRSQLMDSGPRGPRLSKLVTLAERPAVPSVADIVAVRQSSKAFYDWRMALERALDSVKELPLVAEDIGKAREVVSAELAEPRHEIADELRRSTALAALQRTVSNLGWSVLAALPTYLAHTDAPIVGAQITATATIDWARRYIEYLRRRAGRRSLLAHYLIFNAAQDQTRSTVPALPQWATEGGATYSY
jgi:hypothetical protein